ncbi:MAG: hypothetical protein ACI9Y1_000062 [Lentisphaeria bacterium]|jgi:hypothetical protein
MSISAIFLPCRDGDDIFAAHFHIDNNGTATHMAVFNIFLGFHRGIN